MTEKVTLISKMEFIFEEGILEEENFDFLESLKSGRLKINIPEATIVDENGKLFEQDKDLDMTEVINMFMGGLLEGIKE